MKSQAERKELTKYKDLVKSIRTGILITRTRGDEMKGRPMATSQIDDNGDLWFFTDEFSEKVRDISKNEYVFLNYADPSKNNFVVVCGTATVNVDKEKMKELWTPLNKAWFPKGLEDPRLALIKVEPVEVEYWSGNSSKIVILFKMIKAILRGKGSSGSHVQMSLTS